MNQFFKASLSFIFLNIISVSSVLAVSIGSASVERFKNDEYEIRWPVSGYSYSDKKVITFSLLDLDRYPSNKQVLSGEALPKVRLVHGAKGLDLMVRVKEVNNAASLGLVHEGRVYWADLKNFTYKNIDKATISKQEVSNSVSSQIKQSSKLAVVAMSILGRVEVNQVLTFRYVLYAVDKTEKEGQSLVQWFATDTQELLGVGTSYQIKPQDAGKLIQVRVTPKNKKGESASAEVFSLPRVPGAPLASNALTEPTWSHGKQIYWASAGQLSGSNKTFTVTVNASQKLDQIKVTDALMSSMSSGIDLNNLKLALQSVDQLYKDIDFNEARAMLPEQTIESRELEFLLIEPRIGNVLVTDTMNASEARLVSNRLKFEQGDDLKLNDLDQKIQIFNERNRTKVRTVLEPGATVGSSDVTVVATPPTPVDFSISANNAGAAATGRNIQSTRLGLNGIFGGTESIGLSYARSKGLDVYNANVDLPIADRDAVISFGYTGVQTNTAVSGLTIAGDAKIYSVQLATPLYRKVGESLDYSIRLVDSTNATAYFGAALTSGNRSKKAVNSLNHDVLFNRETYQWRSLLGIQHHYVDYKDRDVSQQFSGGNIGKVTLNAIQQIDHTSRFSGKWALNAQPIRRQLPNSEKFVIGPDVVRAYSPGAALGDYGAAMSIDLYYTQIVDTKNEKTRFAVQPYVFYDLAYVKSDLASQPNNITRNDVFSAAGFGLKVPMLGQLKNFTTDIFYARALDPRSSMHTSKTRQERIGINFMLTF